MSNEEKSEIEAKREAAADTNAGLFIRCLKYLMDKAPKTSATFAAFVHGEIAREREACAKIADDRAAVCLDATKGPPESLPNVERHTYLEALHIAGLIRARGKS